MAHYFTIAGWLLMALSLLHFSFPRYLNWRQELSTLSLINRQVMYVHSFFIALVVFLIGILCVLCTEDLINTRLGKQLCLGIGVFWAVRLLVQFFGYSSGTWKGKSFETIVHILLAVFWLYLTIIFLTVGLR